MTRTVYLPQDIHQAGKDFLIARDYRIRLGTGINERTLCAEVRDCEAIVLRTANISRRVMQAAPHLK
jgi:D-3-phosphoglycerate dehydrogenase